MGDDVTIRELKRHEIDEAASMTALAMRDNPIYIRVFGDDPDARVKMLERLNVLALSRIVSLGTVVSAESGGAIIGLIGAVPPDACSLSLGERIRMLLSIIGYPLPVIIRLRRWMKRWSELDLAERHWHLGPAAVAPNLQGRGVGSRMLDECCRMMDAKGAASYLETDKPINVTLYRRFGFEVVQEAEVLGAPNWFMRRAPKGL